MTLDAHQPHHAGLSPHPASDLQDSDGTDARGAPVSRRAVLGTGLAGAGALALAACGGGSGSSSSPGTGSGGSGHGSANTGIVALSAVAVGASKLETLPDGSPVIVTRTGANSVVCHSAICTHAGCTVAPVGQRLACPCHGSLYDARTGKVLAGPAPRPLPSVPVAVVKGEVVQAQ